MPEWIIYIPMALFAAAGISTGLKSYGLAVMFFGYGIVMTAVVHAVMIKQVANGFAN